MIDKKFIYWLVGVIVWNFGFPLVSPIYDVIMVIILKQGVTYLKV